jgi:hypothetical protein
MMIMDVDDPRYLVDVAIAVSNNHWHTTSNPIPSVYISHNNAYTESKRQPINFGLAIISITQRHRYRAHAIRTN